MKIEKIDVLLGIADVEAGDSGVDGKATYKDGIVSVAFAVRCTEETVLQRLARLERVIAAAFSDGEESDEKTGDDPRQYLIGMFDNLTKRVEALDAGLAETARSIVEVQDTVAQCTYGISTLTKAEALLMREDALLPAQASSASATAKLVTHLQERLDAEVKQRDVLSSRMIKMAEASSELAACVNEVSRNVASASVRIETKLAEQEKAREAEVAALRRELHTLGDSVNAGMTAQMALNERVARLEVGAATVAPKEPQVEEINKISMSAAGDNKELWQQTEPEPGNACIAQLPAEEQKRLRSFAKSASFTDAAEQRAKGIVSEGAIAAAKLGARPDAPPPDAVKAFGIDVDAPPFATEEPLDESEDALPGDEKKLSVVQLMHDAAAMESCIAELQAFAKDASAYFKEANNNQALPFSRLLFAIAKYECQSTTAIDRWVSKRVEDKAELRAYIAAFVNCLLEEGNDAYIRGNVKKLAAHFVQPMIGVLLAPGRIMPLDQIESALAAARGAVKSLTAAQGSA